MATLQATAVGCAALLETFRALEQLQTPRSARRRRILTTSQHRNIAEGFGRFEGKEFAQFLKVALGSLDETRNHLIDVCDRGIITAAERDSCTALARRAAAATTGLRTYLLSDRNKMSNKRTFKAKRRPPMPDREP